MWQSRIEIKYYSVVYFERVTKFDALCLGWGSYVLRERIRYSCIYIACTSPTLSESSALQHVKLSDALEIRNRIIFDFYSGLPHVCYKHYTCCLFKGVYHVHIYMYTCIYNTEATQKLIFCFWPVLGINFHMIRCNRYSACNHSVYTICPVAGFK